MINNISLLIFLLSIIFLFSSIFKNNKNKLKYSTISLFVSLIVFGITLPDTAPNLELSDSIFYTDETGNATITGKVNKESELTIDGTKTSISSNGKFKAIVTLEDPDEEVISVLAKLNDNEEKRS